MALSIALWRVGEAGLTAIPPGRLSEERKLENWIIDDPTIIGLDSLVIGNQVRTDFGGIIDILALDRSGNLTIIELKKGKTPREVVAQVLDYAYWIRSLDISDVDSITQKHTGRNLENYFIENFGEPLPETINASHSMIIVASEMDESSQRIVEYLAEEYGININTVFFSFFVSDDQELLGRAWLLNPTEVKERARSKSQPVWLGYWFVNVGEGEHRNWEDNVKYGYLGAGQGPQYSKPLQLLSVRDKVFAYMKGRGYVGYGEVSAGAIPIKDFIVEGFSNNLLDLPLKATKASKNSDNPELSEWAVGINWQKTYPRNEAKTFKGIFANQNIVCKLRNEATITFLKTEFGLTNSA